MKFFSKWNDKAALIFVYALAGFLCASGTIVARRGNWVDFAAQIAAAFFIILAAHNASICHKLNERFDRLEELLTQNCKKEKGKESKE